MRERLDADKPKNPWRDAGAKRAPSESAPTSEVKPRISKLA